MRAPPTWILLVALVGAPALGEVRASARATLISGVDTNARRDYESSLNGFDGVAGLLLDLGAQWRSDRAEATADYSAGGRKFFRFPTEDVLVQAATVQAGYAVTGSSAVGVLGVAKDRRGAERDYTDLSASATFDFFPDERLDTRLRLGAHRFVYRPAFAYSFGALVAGASASWRFDRRHSASLFGEYGDRRYNGPRRLRTDDGLAFSGRRSDRALLAGVGYEYRGPVRVRVDYSYGEQSSDSFGESNDRHRVAALFGARLFWRVQLIAQGALQLTRFPDGVFLSPEIILVQDEENSNSLSVKLLRPLTERLDLELRYAVYQYRFPVNELDYLRQVVWGGLTVRL